MKTFRRILGWSIISGLVIGYGFIEIEIHGPLVFFGGLGFLAVIIALVAFAIYLID